MTDATSEAVQARAARLAGAMYLIIMVTAIFGESFVRSSLIVRGDATQTAQNIIGSERLFRIGIAADLATFTGVVVLIWALYVLLRPVGRNLALLAVFLRLAEVAIHYVATLFGLVALVFLSGADYLNTFDASQLYTLARVAISAQGAGLNLGFALLGLGSTAFAYLLLRSGYVPKALAAWGMFSSLLLTTSAVSFIVFPAMGRFGIAAMAPMGIYEVTLGFWLLLKGANIRSISASAA
jgi:uncharacterized protein DUF4386